MNTSTQICADLLQCGILDALRLAELIETYDLSIAELIEDSWLELTCRIDANTAFYLVLSCIAERFICELPSKVRLNASTLEYQVFTNCLDSHVWFDDEHIEAHFQDWRKD